MNALETHTNHIYSWPALKATPAFLSTSVLSPSMALQLQEQRTEIQDFATKNLATSLPLHHCTECGMECFVHKHSLILIDPLFDTAPLRRGRKLSEERVTPVVIHIFQKGQAPLSPTPSEIFHCTLQGTKMEKHVAIYPGTPLPLFISEMLEALFRPDFPSLAFKQIVDYFSQEEHLEMLLALKLDHCIVSDKEKLFFLTSPSSEPLLTPERAHARSRGELLPPSMSEGVWRLGALGAMLLGGKDLREYVEPPRFGKRPRFLHTLLEMNYFSELHQQQIPPPAQSDPQLQRIASMLHPDPSQRPRLTALRTPSPVDSWASSDPGSRRDSRETPRNIVE